MNVDPALLSWIEGRITGSQEALEKRLIHEREFVSGLLSTAVKVCAIVGTIVLAVFAFFGIREFSSIDTKIQDAITAKMAEKTRELEREFNENVQVVVDKALVTAYSVELARNRSVAILPSHLQRFVQVLSSKNTDQATFTSLVDLLSGSVINDRAGLVRKTIIQVVRGVDQ